VFFRQKTKKTRHKNNDFQLKPVKKEQLKTTKNSVLSPYFDKKTHFGVTIFRATICVKAKSDRLKQRLKKKEKKTYTKLIININNKQIRVIDPDKTTFQ